MKSIWTVAALVALTAGAHTASADSRLVATVPSSDGVFVWMDGSYQSINLPTYSLGFFSKNATGAFVSPSTTFNPRVSGAGFTGGAGHMFRDGTFAPGFGSNVRLEAGFSIINATAANSGAGIASRDFGLQDLNGEGLVNLNCGPACQAGPSTLTTDYRSWQVNLKGASDFKFGAVTLTPSVAVFGGNSRNRQDLTQGAFNIAIPGTNLGTYRLSSSLDWNDWGAKIGLKSVFDVTRILAIGLGGGIGVAARDVDLAANDSISGILFPTATSSLSRNANATAFLANAEANVTLTPWSGIALRGFVGLNFDSHVPGISAPTYATFPNQLGAGAVTGISPAGINFHGETSYYFGGGLTVKFAPGDGALASIR